MKTLAPLSAEAAPRLVGEIKKVARRQRVRRVSELDLRGVLVEQWLVERGASLEQVWKIVVPAGASASLDLAVTLERDARFVGRVEVVGGGSLKLRRTLRLLGSRAHGQWLVKGLVEEKGVFVEDSWVWVRGEEVEARLQSKMVLTTEGQFTGRHYSRAGAPKMSGRVKSELQVLRLSPKTGARLLPEVGAFHPDCKVEHGAAVTNLSGSQIDYLSAQGLVEESARQLLVEAFYD